MGKILLKLTFYYIKICVFFVLFGGGVDLVSCLSAADQPKWSGVVAVSSSVDPKHQVWLCGVIADGQQVRVEKFSIFWGNGGFENISGATFQIQPNSRVVAINQCALLADSLVIVGQLEIESQRRLGFAISVSTNAPLNILWKRLIGSQSMSSDNQQVWFCSQLPSWRSILLVGTRDLDGRMFVLDLRPTDGLILSEHLVEAGVSILPLSVLAADGDEFFVFARTRGHLIGYPMASEGFLAVKYTLDSSGGVVGGLQVQWQTHTEPSVQVGGWWSDFNSHYNSGVSITSVKLQDGSDTGRFRAILTISTAEACGLSVKIFDFDSSSGELISSPDAASVNFKSLIKLANDNGQQKIVLGNLVVSSQLGALMQVITPGTSKMHFLQLQIPLDIYDGIAVRALASSDIAEQSLTTKAFDAVFLSGDNITNGADLAGFVAITKDASSFLLIKEGTESDLIATTSAANLIASTTTFNLIASTSTADLTSISSPTKTRLMASTTELDGSSRLLETTSTLKKSSETATEAVSSSLVHEPDITQTTFINEPTSTLVESTSSSVAVDDSSASSTMNRSPPTSTTSPDEPPTSPTPSNELLTPAVVVAAGLVSALGGLFGLWWLFKLRSRKPTTHSQFNLDANGATRASTREVLSHDENKRRIEFKKSTGRSNSIKPQLLTRRTRTQIAESQQGNHHHHPATLSVSQQELSVPGFLELEDNSQQFRVEKYLTRGGSGTVSLARPLGQDLKRRLFSGATASRQTQMCVVKKLFKPRENFSFLQKAFFQEIALLWYFRDNVRFAKIGGFCLEPDLMIIMKYYPDGSLIDYINEHKNDVNWINVADMFALQIALGLRDLHQAGFVHCDVKPGNILIDNKTNGQVFAVLTDFGISKVVDSKSLLVSAFEPAHINGASIYYAAPEVLSRLLLRQTSAASHDQSSNTGSFSANIVKAGDVYSFSMTLFHLITTERPWKAFKDQNQVSQMVCQSQRPPIPAELARDLGDGGTTTHKMRKLYDLMKKCWAHDPLSRPQFDDVCLIIE